MARAWMPLYIADYLADTSHLSTTEHGAYLLMIMHYWQHGALPCDKKSLRQIARFSTSQCAQYLHRVLAFFELVDGQYRHKRIDAELIVSQEKYAKRSEAGKRSGEARRNLNNDRTMFEPTAARASATSHAQSQSHKDSTPARPTPPVDEVRASVPAKFSFNDLEKRLCDAAQPMPIATNPDISAISQLLANGYDLELDVLPALASAIAAGKRFRAWDSLIGWVERTNKGRKRAEASKPTTTAAPQSNVVPIKPQIVETDAQRARRLQVEEARRIWEERVMQQDRDDLIEGERQRSEARKQAREA